MCGIAGLIDASRSPAALDGVIRAMTATLRPRGPDDGGVHVAAGIALGHRRLSIRDLTPAGAQPMSLGEQGPFIVFNGEIYNFIELRRELELLGHAFRSHSDTEVMLRVYAQWGLDGLQRLEGIFAFALWDPPARRLVLMRDRLGVKPLYFSHSGDTVVFGSEIKAVLAAGGIDSRIDLQALAEYLWYGNAYEDRTFYSGIRSLPPGHWLIVEHGKATLEAWWRIEDWYDESAAGDSLDAAAEAVRTVVDEAVQRQLVADVPVGIFLSGGIDSSAIAASAMRVQAKPLASYSVGFDFNREADELPKARQVARHLGLEHHEVHVSGSNLQDVVLALASAHDEPFADAANIPLYLLARQLQGSIKVVLQGDGGDEMFAGYRRYALLRQAGLWNAVPGPAMALARFLKGPGERVMRLADAMKAEDSAMRMALLLTMETRRHPPTSVLTPAARRHLELTTDPFLAYRRCAARFASTDPVQQMLLTDIALQLPSQFLAKVDRATMACGLEARVPLLDEKVARLAVNLPARWKVGGGQKKIVLRKAMRGRVPDTILDGPKSGFGVPYAHWLRGPLHDFAREAILDGGLASRFGMDGAALGRLLEEHKSERRDNGFLLWKLLQLALWRPSSPQ